MRKNYITTILGILSVVCGFLLLEIIDPETVLKALPYVLIGIGCGAFGHGVGDIVNQRIVKNDPDIQKKIKIEEKDERNIAIANRAKAKAYDLMVFAFGALMISFSLMGIDMIAILLLVSIYLFVVGYSLYYRFKYEKEM